MRAAAWLAAQSFHGSAAHAAPTPVVPPAAATDTRPRRDYILPSGEIVAIILDHDETPKAEITFALRGGQIVTAQLSPIQRREIEALLGYACRPSALDAQLRRVAYGALGAGDPAAGFVALTHGERRSCITACAAKLAQLRAEGVDLGVPAGGGR